MFYGLLTLVTALTISAVAIYYSVAGLVAIFAAAAVPIIIMGGSLEIGKLVTAVWLHRHWDKARWWLKTYLSIAVVVLMFITSMGIFGFLSKAHVEQTAASIESVAQVEKLEKQIGRENAIIERAEDQIVKIESSGSGADSNIQLQIDKEQERINSAYTRIQPAIDEQNAIIAGGAKLYQDQIDRIDKNLEKLQEYIDNGEIEKAQGMIGTKADGDYGPKTAIAFKDYVDSNQFDRLQLVYKIEDLAIDGTEVGAAREEIKRLRDLAQQQIDDSNKLITRLRAQLGKDRVEDIDAIIDEQYEKIKVANTNIDTYTTKKYEIEGVYRQLEAEVGPIKYIAEFVYGEEATRDLLEEAVRWVIIIIIFVFDPLAVLLLIASQYTFRYVREEKGRIALDDLIDYLYAWFLSLIPEAPEIKPRKKPLPPPKPKAPPVEKPSVPDVVVPQEALDDEDDVYWDSAKKEWKKKQPEGETIKRYKKKKYRGEINTLPWEEQEFLKEMAVPETIPEHKHVTAIQTDIDEVLKVVSDAEEAEAKASFGTNFPSGPQKGEMFLRVDTLPTKLYKFNGTKWIEIDKDMSETYTYNPAYVKFLVNKISQGEYDPDLLSDAEQEQLRRYLRESGDQ